MQPAGGTEARARPLRACGRVGRASSPCSFSRALLLPLAAIAQNLPALTGRVVDDAGLIDAATEALLVAEARRFRGKILRPDRRRDHSRASTARRSSPTPTGCSAPGRSARRGEDNGILLLVARDDRKMRIEVGYGLEGTLTDLHSRLIIENTMVPAFRAGDFSGGISRAVDDIVMVLEGNAAELEARAKRNENTAWDPDTIFVVLFLIVWATIFFGGFAMAILPRMFGRKLGPGRYAGSA